MVNIRQMCVWVRFQFAYQMRAPFESNAEKAQFEKERKLWRSSSGYWFLCDGLLRVFPPNWEWIIRLKGNTGGCGRFAWSERKHNINWAPCKPTLRRDGAPAPIRSFIIQYRSSDSRHYAEWKGPINCKQLCLEMSSWGDVEVWWVMVTPTWLGLNFPLWNMPIHFIH